MKNNQLVKFGLIVSIVFFGLYLVLKPIVYNETKYKVVIVNTSEYSIASAVISAVDQTSGIIGPIHVGKVNDFIFAPLKDGELSYVINQNGRKITGVIKPELKKGAVGEIYVVVSEMYKVTIYDSFDI